MVDSSSKIWKLFFGSGSVTLFNTLRAFVINKLLAVFLPPAAFACVGQFMNWMKTLRVRTPVTCVPISTC